MDVVKHIGVVAKSEEDAVRPSKGLEQSTSFSASLRTEQYTRSFRIQGSGEVSIVFQIVEKE